MVQNKVRNNLIAISPFISTTSFEVVFYLDQSVQWTFEEKLLRCSMKSLHFEVESQKPCLIGLHIPHKSKLIKRVRVVHIVNRITNLGDDLIIRLWIHNDNELEHQVSTMILYHLHNRGEFQRNVKYSFQ